MKRLLSAVLLLAAVGSASAQAQTRRQVALELVLAIDCSTSVDASEYALQRDGLAAAFRHSSVQGAIAGLGPEGMAVTIVQWAGRRNATLGTSWTFISGPGGANAFADQIAKMARRVNGRTDIYTAVDYAHRQLRVNDYTGWRRAIDVSGDGSSDLSNPAPARDAAVADGVTVNGLVIYSDEYDLGELANVELFTHYTNFVIGGPGAFVMEARDYEDFALAIRRKLVREISGPNVARNGFAVGSATR